MGGGAPASPYAGYLEKQHSKRLHTLSKAKHLLALHYLMSEPTSLSYQEMSLGNSNCRWTCSTSPMPLPSHISSCVDNILEAPPICLNFTRMGS
uniref:Uncharacterized protein n=1 Tax=Ditylenchus dipsaci TaxID=166011 RepID=A0A915DS27_9BILA